MNSTVSCGTMPICARTDACVTSRISCPSMVTLPTFDVVEAIENARDRRLSRARRPHHGDRLAGGHSEADALEHDARRLISEDDIVEFDLAAGDDEVFRTRLVLHFLRLIEKPEHRLHIDKRLRDLAIDGAQEIERLIELHQDGVAHHEIADGELALRDADRRQHHHEAHADRHDRGLPGVEERERDLRLDRGAANISPSICRSAASHAPSLLKYLTVS